MRPQGATNCRDRRIPAFHTGAAARHIAFVQRRARWIPYDEGLDRSRPSTFASILRQLCPRCRSEKIFRSSLYWGFPKMNDRCPACGLHFDREPGYFLGAMYVSYGLGLAMIAVFGVLLWMLTGWRVDKVAIWAIVWFLPFAPMLTFLSRVLWIYLDQGFDPEKDG